MESNNSKINKGEKKPKVLVILGTTASGKTALGVKLALKFNGEIISADSRQVYRGLDIGTGKDLKEYRVGRKKIAYHLIDVADPRQRFDLAKYQKLCQRAIGDILKRGKLPIIVGGSGLYLQAVIDNYELIRTAKPDLKKRAINEQKSLAELFNLLFQLKPEFASRLNNSDRNNKRRLVRYLEIIESGDLNKVKKGEVFYDFFIQGLSWPDNILRERIIYRLLLRLEKEGMVAEVKRLNDDGVSFEQLKSFGLEYKFISQHLLGELNYRDMVEKLGTAIYRFAKRQKTWFKRWEKQGTNINWNNKEELVINNIAKWLKK